MVPLSDDSTTSMKKKARNVKLGMLYYAINTILCPLMANVLRGFSVCFENKHCEYHPNVESYCCNTPDVKHMSGVKHGGMCRP